LGRTQRSERRDLGLALERVLAREQFIKNQTEREYNGLIYFPVTQFDQALFWGNG
jgi:hypothetical protein